MRKYNPDTQKCVDIYKTGCEHKVRIYCKDGTISEGFPETMCDYEKDDGKEEDCIVITLEDGSPYGIAGSAIDHFEIIE